MRLWGIHFEEVFILPWTIFHGGCPQLSIHLSSTRIVGDDPHSVEPLRHQVLARLRPHQQLELLRPAAMAHSRFFLLVQIETARLPVHFEQLIGAVLLYGVVDGQQLVGAHRRRLDPVDGLGGPPLPTLLELGLAEGDGGCGVAGQVVELQEGLFGGGTSGCGGGDWRWGSGGGGCGGGGCACGWDCGGRGGDWCGCCWRKFVVYLFPTFLFAQPQKILHRDTNVGMGTLQGIVLIDSLDLDDLHGAGLSGGTGGL